MGVVSDAKYQHLREPIMKTMYISWLQRNGDQPTRYSYLARVSKAEPMRLAPSLERLVQEVDPSLHVRTTLTYATLIERSMATERIMATDRDVVLAVGLPLSFATTVRPPFA